VREDCGVFDVSHMGEFEFEGPKVPAALQRLLSNDIDKVDVGGAQYTLLTNERGGIIDDLIVYRVEGGRFLLIVNASNREADFEWIEERGAGTDLRDKSDEFALLASRGRARSSGSASTRLRVHVARCARSPGSRSWSTAPATRARRA
jgi:aminomethyltransferase